MPRKTVWLLLLIIVSVCLCRCGTPSPGGDATQSPEVEIIPETEPITGEPPPSCESITATTTSPSLSGDVSSVTVVSGTIGTYDDTGKVWCTPEDLEVQKVDVNNVISETSCFQSTSTITPCEPYNALAAIDVQPTNIEFPDTPQPKLRYDLSVTDNKPECLRKTDPKVECGDYEIYQLLDSATSTGVWWRAVGDATETSYDSKAVAEGIINHFSVFALVELPQPRPLTSTLTLTQTIIASDFITDDQNAIRVALEIVESNLPENGETRLFRFTGVDPAWDAEELPNECRDLELPAELLTCSFPIGMPVTIELGINGTANLNAIASDSGHYALLYASVEIY